MGRGMKARRRGWVFVFVRIEEGDDRGKLFISDLVCCLNYYILIHNKYKKVLFIIFLKKDDQNCIILKM